MRLLYSNELFALDAIFLFVHQFFEKKTRFSGVAICFSFGRQLCQKFGGAGSEIYVRTHINESPCFFEILENS